MRITKSRKDKVKISPDSEYYGINYINPIDEVGTVEGIYSGNLFIQVKWEAGTNFYAIRDLIIVEQDTCYDFPVF